MRFLRQVLPVLVFCLWAVTAVSQPDTCRLRISLLTCSAGEDLYSAWGHTGVRLIDSTKGVDVVFNYGTFDTEDPLFYVKFTRGIMTYSLSVWPMKDFMTEYEYEHRSVTEQVLLLSCAEKEKLKNALIENAQEANRYYSYHFYRDNCTTRARDIIVKNTGATVAFKNILPGNPSFRNLIHFYLDKQGLYWHKLGIDILLGSNLDKKAGNDGSMFLPDYLMYNFDSAAVNGKPLVEGKTMLLNAAPQKESTGMSIPFSLFAALFFLVVALTFAKEKPWIKTTLRIFDIVFFLLLGLLGILLALLWIIRVDTVCRDNFNILLMLPTHAFIIFFLGKQRAWTDVYWLITFIITILLLICWFWLPQQLNNALAPIAAIVLLRSCILNSRLRKKIKP